MLYQILSAAQTTIVLFPASVMLPIYWQDDVKYMKGNAGTLT